MNKKELNTEIQKLQLKLEAKYPKKTEGCVRARVIEYRNKKYLIEYDYNSKSISRIKKKGDELFCLSNCPAFSSYTDEELSKIVSLLNTILKGTEIVDGPILKVFENGEKSHFYNATMRFECEIDAQRIFVVFARLNNKVLERDSHYMIGMNEYIDISAKLSIHRDYNINDIKAMLLYFDEELPDCHIAIQSLDYAQYEWMRDRNSHYPSIETQEEWFDKLDTMFRYDYATAI